MNHNLSTVEKIQIDTLVRHDTIRIESPVEIRRIKTTDTLILPITDTLRVRDTVYLVLNREIKEYRDSLYYARVSGYQPNLDFIEVYPKTTTISKMETIIRDHSPWHYSLDFTFDYRRMGATYIEPGISAELGYNRLTLGAEVGLNTRIEESVLQNPYLYWKAGIKYNLLRR